MTTNFQSGFLGGGYLTKGARVILFGTIGLYVVQYIADILTEGGFTSLFGLSAAGVKKGYIWQFFTYMFLHGGLFHLFINMLGFFFFGPEMERTLGTRQFYFLYFLSGLLGGIGWYIISGLQVQWGVCIGASGAVFGILGAFAALYPNRPITLLLFFVLPVTLKAWVIVGALMLIQLMAVIAQDPGASIAYAAHLAGGIGGIMYMMTIYKEKLGIYRYMHRKRSSSKLRVMTKPDPSSSSLTHEEIDRILEKIAQEGMSSLTKKERELLDRASKKL